MSCHLSAVHARSALSHISRSDGKSNRLSATTCPTGSRIIASTSTIFLPAAKNPVVETWHPPPCAGVLEPGIHSRRSHVASPASSACHFLFPNALLYPLESPPSLMGSHRPRSKIHAGGSTQRFIFCNPLKRLEIVTVMPPRTSFLITPLPRARALIQTLCHDTA